MRLSVIIPAYNESVRIGRTLEATDDFLAASRYDHEIVVVDDGSRDRTREAVRALARQRPAIRLVEQPRNLGKGAAIRRGLTEARGDWLLFVDADGSAAIEHLELAWPLLDQGPDLIIGSRHPYDRPGAGQTVSQPIWKRLCGGGGNLLIQLCVLPGIWDSQCAFKLFSRRAAQVIAANSVIDRWLFDVEALLIARQYGFRHALIPIKWQNEPDSRVGWKDYLVSLGEVLRLAGRRLGRRYSPAGKCLATDRPVEELGDLT